MLDPWRIAAVAIMVLAVALMAWALLWDRPRGRRRCPRCWYDMAGAATRQCPECGRTARSDRALRRTRRRWRWGILVVPLLIGSYGAWNAERAIAHGWIGLAPTTGLILVMQPASSDDAELNRYVSGGMNTAERELDRRLKAGEIADWQVRLAVDRARIVRVRQRWPEGRDLGVRLVVPAWLGSTEVHAKARGLPGSAQGRLGSDYRMYEFGPLPTGTSRVEFDLEVRMPTPPDRAVPATASHRVRLVASVEDAIARRDDAEANEAMARAIRVGTGHERTGRFANVPFLAIHVVRTNEPIVAGLALGVEVEYLRDGEVMHTVAFPLSSMTGSFTDTWGYWVRMTEFEDSWDESDPADMARWTIRIRGSGDQAIEDFGREEYWAGTLEYPLQSVLRAPN